MNILSILRRGTHARWLLMFASASIVLMVVACTGRPAVASLKEPTASSVRNAVAQAPTTVPSPTAEPVETGVPPGPLVNIAFASTLNDQGQLVDPKFTFAPDQSQITAIVQVGVVTGTNAPLTITWYRLNDDDTAEKLFEHQVTVTSYDRAYSTAQNPGTLAEGTYSVAASLAGQTQETQMDVQFKRTTGAPSGVAQAGKPPVSGPSGKTSRSTGKPASPPAGGIDCGSDNIVDDTSLNGTDPTADVIDFWIGGACQGIIIPIQLSATLNGETLSRTLPPDNHELQLNPCIFQNGSDLPGTQVHFTAFGLYQGQHIPGSFNQGVGDITLGDDTRAPTLKVGSTPPHGSKVKAGDQIQVDVTADETRSGGPWQTGVQVIQVTAPNAGGLVGTPWTNPASPLSQRCDGKTWTKDYRVTYTVPPNPPAQIHLCAVADDYAGNERTQCADFPTDQVTLQGNYEYSWDYDAKNMPWHFAGNSTATFTAQAGEGNSMTGTALVHWTGTGKGSDPQGKCAWTFSTGDISWRVDLKGTFQKNADGSSSVFLMPTPVQGPLGPPLVGGCPNNRPPDRITTAAFSVYGTLVNGHLDTRLDLPIDGQGYNRLVTHIELVPNK